MVSAPPAAPEQQPQDDDPAKPQFLHALIRRFPGLADAFAGFDKRVFVILIASAILLLIYRKFGHSGTFEGPLRPESLTKHRYLSVFGDYYWFVSSFFILGLAPALVLFAIREKRTGLGLGDWRFGLKGTFGLFAVMLPVVFIASRSAGFSKFYPLNHLLRGEALAFFGNAAQPPHEDFLFYFLIYELLYAFYFIGWEYFFRGFLTFGLYDRFGMNGVLIGNVPFVLLHAGKPFPEALGSIIAGFALGLFALRARSFWYGWILHAGIAVFMDIVAIQARIAAG